MKVPTKETNTWLQGKQEKIYLIFTLEERNVFLAIFFSKKKKRY